jgi:hypothetical protein
VLARPPTRRAIPAAANAGRVVVNGGWYQGDEIAGQSKAAAFPLRAEVLYCGGSAVRVIWIGSRSELRNPDTNVAIILATARTE